MKNINVSVVKTRYYLHVKNMQKKTVITRLLAIFVCCSVLPSTRKLDALTAPNKVRLLDLKTIQVHGNIVYKYNSSVGGEIVPVSIALWANNFWTEIELLKTSPRA
jgi:hypothetical protein